MMKTDQKVCQCVGDHIYPAVPLDGFTYKKYEFISATIIGPLALATDKVPEVVVVGDVRICTG